MRARLFVPLLAVVALALPLAAESQQTSRGKGGGRAAHPKVNAVDTCEECHADATPAVFRDWRQSAHGLNLVKCFVCHGSTGADFRVKPVADRCIGCHGDQVTSLRAPAMKGKDCFSCHAPHALNPHAHGGAPSAAAALGADRLPPMETVEGVIAPAGPPAAPKAQPGTAGAPATSAAPQQAGTAAPADAPAAGPGAEKDLTHSKPHPPTSR